MKDKTERKRKKAEKEHKHKKSKKEHKHKKAKKEKDDHNETKINKICMVKRDLGNDDTTVTSTIDLGTHNQKTKQRSKPRTQITNKNESVSPGKSTSTKTTAKQIQTPKPKSYVSASDSDSTDNDDRSPATRPFVNKPATTSLPSRSIPPSTTGRPLSDSDSDSTDNEAQRLSKPVLPAKRSKPTSLNKSTSGSSSAKQSKHVPSKKQPNSVTKQHPTPNGKGYISASDSDSTDNEARPPPARRSILRKPALATKPIPPTSKSAKSSTKRPVSDSDSDSTDNEARKQRPKPMAAKEPPKSIHTERFHLPTAPSASTPRTKAYISDSSDDDDDDNGDNDGSEDNNKQQQQHNTNPTEVASRLLDDNDSSRHTSDDDSGYGEVVEATFRNRKIIERDTKRGEYGNNRLQHLRMYRNAHTDAAMEYKNRYVDEADKYNVQHDFFISDSESESDSNDDYSTPPHPWHARIFNGAQWKAKLAENKDWKIKTGKFSRVEDIRLEKRVKKICRREGLDLAGFRDKMTENALENQLFWRKIAKVFPDRPLNLILITCRARYSEHAYKNDPWTEDMDRQLVEYIKVYGKNYSKLENLMNRPRKELQVHATELLNPETKRRKLEPWTDEQTQEFYDKVKTAKNKSTWTNWQDFAASHYKGKRTGYQCRSKWQSRNVKTPMTISTKLAIINTLAKQKHEKETELDMASVSDELGYPADKIKTFYLKVRSTIPNFEKKNVPDILAILDKRFTEMEKSMED